MDVILMLNEDRIKNIYEYWKNDLYFDEETRMQAASLSEDEIADCFYKDLEFGTSGMRGLMGVGTNRLNRYTVRKATSGFARYLKGKYGEEAKRKGVVIAYDCRHNSASLPLKLPLCFAPRG